MNKDIKYLLISIIFTLIIRLLFIFAIPIDSDEVTYSIIVRRVLSREDFHIFALNQKYMGAIEGYIIGIFQALFGYNLVTLRINSLIFSILSSMSIFLVLNKLTSNKHLSLIGSLFFSIA